MQVKATAKKLGKKLLRPIWARVWARIERRIRAGETRIEQRIEASEMRGEQRIEAGEQRFQARETDLFESLWDNMNQLQAQVQGVVERLRSEALRLQVFEDNIPQLTDQLRGAFSIKIAELQSQLGGLHSIEQLKAELSAQIDELSRRIEDDAREVHLVRERMEVIRREFISELRSVLVEDRAGERRSD